MIIVNSQIEIFRSAPHVELKAISLLQPWAEAVVRGVKKFETRSWQTNYRGPLFIHASQKVKKVDFFRFWQILGVQKERDVQTWPVRSKTYPFTLGAIIGIVQLVDCQPTEIIREQLYHGRPLCNNAELVLGDYDDHRYAWQLQDPIKFKTPVPFKGALSIWDVDRQKEDRIDLLKLQMALRESILYTDYNTYHKTEIKIRDLYDHYRHAG